MGNKAQCRFCEFEVGKKCTKKKNSKVSLKKKRLCNLYRGDMDKITAYADKKAEAIRPDVILRPDWFWSRSKRKKERNKIIEQEMARYQTTASKDIPIPQEQMQNSKYPKTGDLTRFVTETAPDEDQGT